MGRKTLTQSISVQQHSYFGPHAANRHSVVTAEHQVGLHRYRFSCSNWFSQLHVHFHINRLLDYQQPWP